MKQKLTVLLLSTSIFITPYQGAIAAPAAAQPYSAADISGIGQINPKVIFEAIDAGDLQRLKGHLNFAKTFAQINPDSAPNFTNTIEFRDSAGNTPLIRASMQKNLDIVNYLIQNGANIDAVNYSKESSLVTSYVYGNYDVTRLLIARGAADPYSMVTLLDQMQVAPVAGHAAAAAPKETGLMSGLSGTKWGMIAAAGGLTGAVGALAGGATGGGDGGSPPVVGGAVIDCGAGAGIHPENCDPTSFDTPEAQEQEGVLGMKANFAYAHGYDGRIFNRQLDGTLIDDQPDGNVIVAVVDTGVDMTHEELDSVMLTNLSVTCSAFGVCTQGGSDQGNHGTRVTGVLAAERNENGTGMHGVAPGVRVIAVSAGTNAGIFLGGAYAGIDHALDNGAQVINNSYGSATTITGASVADMQAYVGAAGGTVTGRQVFQKAVDNHAIIVYAAGNSGGAQPSLNAGIPLYFQGAIAPIGVSQIDYDAVNPTHLDWSNNWVSVVSVDNSNVISGFSQRCGVTKDWCIAAPGEISSSTDVGGGYTGTITGTSFAAPNVTGAIAIMLGAFPQLSPERVLQIIFDTATDLGVAGVDDVYGHGLLNLQRASDPTIGGWVLSTGNGMSYGMGTSGFGLSSAFGNSLSNTPIVLIFQDGYSKDYTVPLSAVSASLARRDAAFNKFRDFGRPDEKKVVSLGEGATLSLSQSDKENIDPSRPHVGAFNQFSFQSAVPMLPAGSTIGFSYQTDIADEFIENDSKHLVVSDALRNPYLNLADEANSAMASFRDGSSKIMVTAYSSTTPDEEYHYNFHTKKNVSGVFGEYTYASDDASVSLNEGVVVEEGGMLGSETSGAFNVDNSTTYHGGLEAKYSLADDILLFGNYNMGLTSVDAGGASMFTGFDNLLTNSFALGAEFRNVNNDDDKLGFIISQPMRVLRGSAALTLPYDVATNGDVLFYDSRLSLSPTGRELDFETYYHIRYDEVSQFSLNGMFRVAPDNVVNTSDATLMTKYSLDF